MQLHVIRLLGGEVVDVQRHLFSQGAVLCCRFGYCGAILRRGLCQIGKCHGHFHGAVCGSGLLPPLTGCLMVFSQVGLRFDKMCLEFSPGLFLLQLGLPGLAVFLEFLHFRNKAVGNSDDLPFCYRISRRGRIIDALVQPRVEDFDGLVGILGFPELPVVISQVCCQYPRDVRVQVA